MTNPKTLAVLPFINRSSDPENEYFSDGITEEIINALAKIDALKVISRTSSFYFKGKNIPLKEIAQQLNVHSVLEGSVRVAGDQVRITAQLIQADEDIQLWSETWDRNLNNIFDIQDEISLLIADKLREQLGHFEIAEHLVKKQTDSLDAYQLSLKARYLFNHWNLEDVNNAKELFNEALKIDPNHVESHLGLADCYSFLGTTGFMDPKNAWAQSVKHTNIALDLNPKHPGGHYLRANLSFFMECDFSSSAQHALKSIELKPNYPEGQQFMSFLYALKGDIIMAEKHLSIALDLDPFNQETLFYKAFLLYRKESYMASVAILKDLLSKNSKNVPAFTVLTYCMLKTGNWENTLQLLETVPENVIIPDEDLGIRCLACILKGDKAKTKETLASLELHAEQKDAYQAHSYLFLAYANLKMYDDAFLLLKQSLKQHSPIFLLSFSDPLAHDLKKDERYLDFHRQMYPPVTEPLTNASKKTELLDEHTAKAFTEKLLTFVEQESPYLNPELSLRSLAELIQIHPNQLSWLLNTQLQQNFNEFINQYRVEQFKKLVKDPSNSHISLMGLAFESGFNSKTVFNTFFKKATGMTPSTFAKSQLS